jgi:hypothetical protein
MQTLTLPELVQREGIPDHRPIFHFRKEDGKGIIEFDLPPADEAKPPMSPEEALKQLEALQVDIGRPTNSTKIIRALRRDRYPRRAKPRSVKRRKK